MYKNQNDKNSVSEGSYNLSTDSSETLLIKDLYNYISLSVGKRVSTLIIILKLEHLGL